MAQPNPFDVKAPAQRGAVEVAPGRRMAWSEWGAANGAPVLFSPGAATSSLLGFAADAVERLGVRLISVDRPGLGGSDPAPDRTLLDTAQDIRALAVALALERPAIIGFSQGAPLALACAASDAVSAVAVDSGTDELAGPAMRALLPPEIGHLVDLAASDPPAAEAMFRGMMSPASLKEMIRDRSPDVDRAVYLEPTFAATFAAALDEGFAQGPNGYARDTLLVMQPWPFDPSALRPPVHLWYGGIDASPFHSLDHGASLVRRIPGATRTVIDAAGGSLLWTHGTQILEALLEARSRAADRSPT
jgi:pimeloyl-ACP methyl ester carboxylesterase